MTSFAVAFLVCWVNIVEKVDGFTSLLAAQTVARNVDICMPSYPIMELLNQQRTHAIDKLLIVECNSISK